MMDIAKSIQMVWFDGDDRPYITDDANDWDSLQSFVREPVSAKQQPIIRFSIDHSEATKCDFYTCGLNLYGHYHMMSARAVSVIGPEAFRNFRLLSAEVNGSPYFLLHRMNDSNCLDLTRSVFSPCEPPLDPPLERLLFSIAQYAFHQDAITPNIFFTIPESNYLFCCEKLAQKIKSYLSGFGLIQVCDFVVDHDA
jgi:hypothetical protein